MDHLEPGQHGLPWATHEDPPLHATQLTRLRSAAREWVPELAAFLVLAAATGVRRSWSPSAGTTSISRGMVTIARRIAHGPKASSRRTPTRSGKLRSTPSLARSSKLTGSCASTGRPTLR